MADTNSHQPMLTISEAAKAAGVSRDTIKRQRVAGDFPGARKTGQGSRGTWKIPVTELLQAGYQLDRPQDDAPVEPDPAPVHELGHAPDPALVQQLHELQLQNAQLRGELSAERARAEERGHQVEDLRRTVMMLGAGELPEPKKPKRKRWWNRG